MIVSIHQPLHFPYMGFFEKMKMVDLFVILDDVKFCKNEFYNRNKFTNKQNEVEWFTIPVEKKANSKLIKDVILAEDYGWRKKLRKQLKYNFGNDFKEIYEGDILVDINMRSIEYCRKKLNIKTPMVKSSELDVGGVKSERLANICKKVSATQYISGPFGRHYLDESFFADISIKYFEPKVIDYFTTLSLLGEKNEL